MRNRFRVVVVGCLALLVVAVAMAAGCKKAGSEDGEIKAMDINEKRVGGDAAGTAPAPGATR